MLSKKKMSIVVMLVVAMLPAARPTLAAETINVLTASGNSAYYPLGTALGSAIVKSMPGVKTAVQTTKGSIENLHMLEDGRGEIAFALGDSLSAAWKGNEDAGFKTPLRKLRGIAALYPNYIQIVARADSGIKTLADLKGKRISVGASKSPIELNARAILKSAGLGYKDFAKVEFLPFGESVELMKERQIDATLQSAALGVSGLRDLATSVDLVVVPIPVDVVDNIQDSAYVPATISANTYRGQSTDVPVAAVQNYLVTHEGVSDDTAYGMTKAVWSQLDTLTAAHSAAKAIDMTHAIEGMPVPLHPGAERYYKEVGLIK